ncbi:uncharacterized protein LOC115620795 [Scaptodrosophila lebanonensis]|uniref:Uncharacterized protein LOC115620795 n=1 Tax=Drosophila lebanonensis TaxID=7225 RepID=A0A6J2T475_DROLE|nr:uncharacterized protein LOC115620795 [Scaptodrosophila lebanonensis]
MQRVSTRQSTHGRNIIVNDDTIKFEKLDDEDGMGLRSDDDKEDLKYGLMTKELETRPQRMLMPGKPNMKLPATRKALLQIIGRDRQRLSAYFQALGPQTSAPAKKERQPVATTTPAPTSGLSRDSYDLFFESACASIKSLPPKLAAEAKSRISQIITEFELRAINEEEALQAKQKGSSTKYAEPIVVSNDQMDDESEIVYKFQAYS